MATETEGKTTGEELKVVIHTPEGVRANTSALNVVVPGEEGDMMILAKHAGVVIPLRTGTLEIRHPGSVEYYAVAGGTLSVEDDSVSISALAAEGAGDIDAERAARARERAEAVLSSETEDHIISEARAALYRALVRLEVHDLGGRG
jgi:F-type H+-transporting ATPase subunit epsilon